jgi:hypothetical protein
LVVTDEPKPALFATPISRSTTSCRSIGSPPVKRKACTPALTASLTNASISAVDGCDLMPGALSTLQWAHVMLQRRVTIIATVFATGASVSVTVTFLLLRGD